MSYMYEDIFERGMERGMERGRSEGISKGIRRGRTSGVRSVVRGMLNMGNISYEDISKCSGMSIDEIKKMAKQYKINIEL